MQGKLNDKLIVEDRLEKVVDIKSEIFLPPIADIIVSQVIEEEHRHKNQKHRENPQKFKKKILFFSLQFVSNNQNDKPSGTCSGLSELEQS